MNLVLAGILLIVDCGFAIFFHFSCIVGMSSALEERWTPDQILGIARELLFECWNHSHESVVDNLYKGRLGAYWLLYELGQLENHQHSVYRHKRPLQQARDGAHQVVNSLPPVWSEQEAQFHYQAQSSLALMHSDWMGAHCLLCACEHRLNNKAASKKNLLTIQQRLLSVKHRGDPSVNRGTAGILQAILWLRQELDTPTLFQSVLVDLAVQMISEGKQHDVLFWPAAAVNSPTPGDTPTILAEALPAQLGASRGVIGILFTLLGCSPSDWKMIDEKLLYSGNRLIQNTINYLLQQVQQALVHGQDHSLIHKVDWAHGACGYIMLLLQSAQTFHQQSYLQQAAILCERLWEHPDQWSHRLGLAYGTSTMAICFLQLSKVCPKPSNLLWQRRAEYILQELARDYKNKPIFCGLYDGLGGLVSVLLQLNHKTVVEMPLFCQGHRSKETPLLLQPLSEEEEVEFQLAIQGVPNEPLHKEPPSVATTPSQARDAKATIYQPMVLSTKNSTRSHFAAAESKEQSLFWSLQTESHIGCADEYKPALIETKANDEYDEEKCKDVTTIDCEIFPTESPKNSSSMLVDSFLSEDHHIPDQRSKIHKGSESIVNGHVEELGKHSYQQPILGSKQATETSTTSPPAPRQSIAKTTLSERKPRPHRLEIPTPSQQGSGRSITILGGKVRLTKAAQLRIQQNKEEATTTSSLSSGKSTSAKPLAPSTSSLQKRNEFPNEPSASALAHSTKTQLNELTQHRRERARQKAKELEQHRRAELASRRSKLKAEEQARIAEAKLAKKQSELANRAKVQQQTSERSERIARQKAEQQVTQELARKKSKGEKSRLEQAKVIREKLEEANRAKVEMQSQWKAERLAKIKAQKQEERESKRAEEVKLERKSNLQQLQDQRRVDESKAKILLRRLEKIKSERDAVDRDPVSVHSDHEHQISAASLNGKVVMVKTSSPSNLSSGPYDLSTLPSELATLPSESQKEISINLVKESLLPEFYNGFANAVESFALNVPVWDGEASRTKVVDRTKETSVISDVAFPELSSFLSEPMQSRGFCTASSSSNQGFRPEGKDCKFVVQVEMNEVHTGVDRLPEDRNSVIAVIPKIEELNANLSSSCHQEARAEVTETPSAETFTSLMDDVRSKPLHPQIGEVDINVDIDIDVDISTDLQTRKNEVHRTADHSSALASIDAIFAKTENDLEFQLASILESPLGKKDVGCAEKASSCEDSTSEKKALHEVQDLSDSGRFLFASGEAPPIGLSHADIHDKHHSEAKTPGDLPVGICNLSSESLFREERPQATTGNFVSVREKDISPQIHAVSRVMGDFAAPGAGIHSGGRNQVEEQTFTVETAVGPQDYSIHSRSVNPSTCIKHTLSCEPDPQKSNIFSVQDESDPRFDSTLGSASAVMRRSEGESLTGDVGREIECLPLEGQLQDSLPPTPSNPDLRLSLADHGLMPVQSSVLQTLSCEVRLCCENEYHLSEESMQTQAAKAVMDDLGLGASKGVLEDANVEILCQTESLDIIRDVSVSGPSRSTKGSENCASLSIIGTTSTAKQESTYTIVEESFDGNFFGGDSNSNPCSNDEASSCRGTEQNFLSTLSVNENQLYEKGSGIESLANKKLADEANLSIAKSISDEAPDGFEAMNELFKEAENKLEAELSAILASPVPREGKSGSNVSPRKEALLFLMPSLSKLSRRKVAAVTEVQSSYSSDASTWTEMFQQSKNKAD